MRSNIVGELPGITVVALLVTDVGAGAEAPGSGLICSAVTSSRCKAVPTGVHVSRVRSGFVVG